MPGPSPPQPKRILTMRQLSHSPLSMIVWLCPVAALLIAGLAKADAKKDEKAKPAPEGAITVFDGKDLTGWVGRKGGSTKWKVKDGYMEVVAAMGDIMTEKRFGPDFQLHVEFWLPYMPNAKGQARANSGVYLQG